MTTTTHARPLLLAALVLLAPGAARALELRLAAPSAPARESGPGLQLPQLRWGAEAAADLGLDPGSGEQIRGAGRKEPVVCLVLGIFPGFGIGHLLAGSDRWVVWLVVDIAIAALFWGPLYYWPDHPGYFPLLNLLVLAERIAQGILAYEAAGGPRVFRLDRGLAGAPPPPVLAALPDGYRPGVRW